MNYKKKRLNEGLLRSINEEHPETDNYLIPDDLSKKVRSFMSIKSDLEDAHSALKELSVMLLMRTVEETIRIAR